MSILVGEGDADALHSVYISVGKNKRLIFHAENALDPKTGLCFCNLLPETLRCVASASFSDSDLTSSIDQRIAKKYEFKTQLF